MVDRALGYPWERPGASYLLRSGDVQLLDDVEPAIEAFIADRHPLLAYGGNAPPSRLTTKFAHLPDEEDRAVSCSPANCTTSMSARPRGVTDGIHVRDAAK